MKISIFPTLLLIMATIALSYLAFNMAHDHSDSNELLVGIGTGLSVILTLGCMLSISLKDNRMNINMKAWSGTAFLVLITTNHCFAGFGVTLPYYLIVIALLLVIHLWVVYKLAIE